MRRVGVRVLLGNSLCKRNISSQHSLKKIRPYWYTYNAFAKPRWFDRELLDIMSLEFQGRPKDYHRYAIECGMVRINEKIAQVDTIVREGDLMSHTLHKHEPPVTSMPIKIIHRDDEQKFIVVDKPSSIATHPSGRYMRSTLSIVLNREFGIPDVFPVNRLDRLTSGLMFIPTSAKSAYALSRDLQKKVVMKEYIAKCIGKFPKHQVVADQPLLRIDETMGLVIVHPEGKDAMTIFNLMHYDPHTDISIVHCRPVTGRLHQIRVHLQYLGHPIPNDPLYGSRAIWGDTLGRGGLNTTPRSSNSVLSTLPQGTKELIIENGDQPPPISFQMPNSNRPVILRPPCALSEEALTVLCNAWRIKAETHDGQWSNWQDAIKQPLRNPLPAELREEPDQNDYIVVSNSQVSGKQEFCDECYVPLAPDPNPEDLCMYLHSWRYTTSFGRFETEMPYWSRDLSSESLLGSYGDASLRVR